MDKKDFRTEQKTKLTAFSASKEKKIEDQAILNLIKNSHILNNYQKIGVTYSLPLEVDTSNLISYLRKLNKEVYLVKVFSKHQLHFLSYTTSSVLGKSAYGLNEVKEGKINDDLDLYIVPGLAFDLSSHQRLGFGGGYYDRFLAKHHGATISLANSKMAFEKAKWPIEHHDLAIDTIVTPNKIYC